MIGFHNRHRVCLGFAGHRLTVLPLLVAASVTTALTARLRKSCFIVTYDPMWVIHLHDTEIWCVEFFTTKCSKDKDFITPPKVALTRLFVILSNRHVQKHCFVSRYSDFFPLVLQTKVMKMACRVGRMILEEKTNVIRKKIIPLSLWPQQISHGLAWNQTVNSMVDD